MGWTLTVLGVALAIVIVAGTALALCRRYCIGWQWGTRNIWNVCEEWRQRLSWLWAPREEKVGLVKAQHPTAQTIPGLYRQPGNASQHLLHSDSDLRLDAQGAFTRYKKHYGCIIHFGFEPVDRDLHPPLGTTTGSTIPPQPLRPAPQPRPTARPRPSPLQTSSTVDQLRMQEVGPVPLTPPPSLQRAPVPSRSSGSSVFLFQNEPIKNYGLHKTSNDHGSFIFDGEATKTVAENIQMASYGSQNHIDSRLRYELGEERRKENRCNPYRQFDGGIESTRIRYGVHGVPIATLDGKGDEDSNTSYGSYDIVQRSHMIRQHIRNDSRGSPSSFGMTNSSNAASQTIMESIYGSEELSKMLQSTQSLGNDLDHKSNEMQSIEMTPFRSSSLQDNIGPSYLFRESQGLQKVSQYIQSLPDLPIYDSINELGLHQDQDRVLYDDTIQESINALKVSEAVSSPIPPPPPAPPDPPKEMPKKNGQTTGERIFNALRLVTSQSYIDASEFYNSVVSSAQQVQRFTFPSRSPSSLVEENTGGQLQDEVQDIYAENDSDMIGPDDCRRSSDLYSPELNLEAHRTAQEVYNSLQDPPSSPLLLKDHNQEIYTYMTDPSFTRTSEDILNSIEQRRKSMERLNGIHELNELDDADTLRKRNDFYVAVEEVQLKRKFSQSFITNYTMNDYNEVNPGSRRGPQGPDPEPPPDESNLKRAISCESVCSDTSVVLNDLEEAPVVGHVCVGVQYDRWSGRGADSEGDLAVSVLEARDLIAPDGQPAQDTFARVCLLPNRQLHVKTRLYRGSPSPSYQENFLFPLDDGPSGRTLLVEVFSDETSIGGGTSLIGEARLRLGPASRAPATTWLPLMGSALPTPRLGELMFSLSYLQTAERLTLVVVKARNLRGANTVPGDFFVKVYLLQQGKKIHKKKTSVKKGEESPIFNEAIIFNVPSHIMQNIQIRLTVAEVSNDQGVNSKPYSVGHIIVGPTSAGRAFVHWRQMLAAQRRPVAMWHPLRK
ncbi:Synaptotagmin-12 [Apis cerana cerana]|uniref:Synaptotagmin-12 n=1 Tax=Apis cerana cerana TaxID=94128 RepID=A0A2A3ESE2_APICC|nr:Synaptotagmin-12 [Apis cerana cerana]